MAAQRQKATGSPAAQLPVQCSCCSNRPLGTHPPTHSKRGRRPSRTPPTWDCRALNSPWILGSGAEPSSTNWPPRSRVRKHECLIRWVPAGGRGRRGVADS
jgi:hypothetical protein